MQPCQVHSGFRNHSRQPGNEIERFENHMDSPIIAGRFELSLSLDFARLYAC